jgi:release factor glutamine methyltransferase
MTTSIADALRRAVDRLNAAGVPDVWREAHALLSHVTGRDRTFLISNAKDPLSEQDVVYFAEAIERRATGEPAQYITGSQDFYGRTFRVTPDVLIPRPETELLVEAALQVVDAQSSICDVGTGSGCIAITLLCERREARAMASDVSAAALEIARQNARELGVEDRIEFLLSDRFSEMDPALHQFDLIVSNPPYVSAGMLPGLQREVRDHEPRVALSPGTDGLSVIRRLINEAPPFIRGDGHLMMEIGFDQGEAVQHLIDGRVWRLREILPDLQSIPRIVVLQKR